MAQQGACDSVVERLRESFPCMALPVSSYTLPEQKPPADPFFLTGKFPRRTMSALGTKRHFVATHQFGRYWR
jgi:hypothetical protein